MSQTASNTPRAIILVALLALGSFTLMTRGALPDGDLTFTALQNFGHFVLFAALGWVVLFALSRLIPGQHYWRGVLISAVVLTSLGLGVEVYQSGMVARNASVADFVLDVAGMVVGFLVFSLPRIRHRRGLFAVLCAALVISVTLFLAMKPVVPLVGFDLLRPSLPVVRKFDHIFSDQKIEAAGGAQFARRSTDERSVLQMKFVPGSYSGVLFHESGGQWSDYQELSIKIFSSLPNDRQIELRINDRLHNNLYGDRYNGSFSISPGFNEVRIPTRLIAMMGRTELSGRQMDIDNVYRIQIFTDHIESSFELDLLSIELK